MYLSKINISKLIIILAFSFTSFLNIYSQGFDLTSYFYYPVGHVSWVEYDYEYVEFDYNAYNDSSIVLESFLGEISVRIDSGDIHSDTSKIKLLISKKGIKVKETFFATLSIDTIDYEYSENVYIIEGVNELGGNNQIYGWIFLDSLAESVIDTLDPTPVYPYSKLYANYYPSNDESLFSIEDTLFIHYRPNFTNYNDSYYSADYKIIRNYGLSSFSRYYSYNQQGFSEKYQATDYGWADVEDEKNNALRTFSLSQNYPNPFNPSTTIKYSIASQKTPLSGGAWGGFVTLKIYDILGQEVATLVNKEQNAGNYEVKFDANELTSGIYFGRLTSGSFTKSIKMLLVR